MKELCVLAFKPLKADLSCRFCQLRIAFAHFILRRHSSVCKSFETDRDGRHKATGPSQTCLRVELEQEVKIQCLCAICPWPYVKPVPGPTDWHHHTRNVQHFWTEEEQLALPVCLCAFALVLELGQTNQSGDDLYAQREVLSTNVMQSFAGQTILLRMHYMHSLIPFRLTTCMSLLRS